MCQNVRWSIPPDTKRIGSFNTGIKELTVPCLAGKKDMWSPPKYQNKTMNICI